MQRQPAVAGQFYPASAEKLLADIKPMLADFNLPKQKAFGTIFPHAGYIYSGAIAAKGFAAVEIPSTVLMLGPNHRGVGAAAALYPEGSWITPLGETFINSCLNTLLVKYTPFLQPDTKAHELEHSLEVQLPFLQHLSPDVSISAISLGYGDFEAIRQIGEGVATALKEFGEDVLILASSDMTHYESAESAERKDRLALERVMAFDPEGLLEVCRKESISMCGAVPAAVMLVATAKLGATKAKLIAYGTSGDVTGDMRQVVGYAAVSLC